MIFEVTPTISTSAYGTGDILCSPITVPNGSRGLLTDCTILDDDGEGVQLDFFLFQGALSGTYTAGEAFVIDAADMSNRRGSFSVPSSGYLAAGSDKQVTHSPINILLKAAPLYVIPVIRSTTTFTATTDLTFIFGIY